MVLIAQVDMSSFFERQVDAAVPKRVAEIQAQHSAAMHSELGMHEQTDLGSVRDELDAFEQKAVASEEALDFSLRNINRRVRTVEAECKRLDDGMEDFVGELNEANAKLAARLEVLAAGTAAKFVDVEGAMRAA